MKNLKFKKEEDNKWYVDLPEWTGDKADLEMVCGADRLLDYLSNKEDKVDTLVFEEPVDDSIILTKRWNIYGGADYSVQNCPGVEYAWLCKVTKFVYDGNLPEKLYIKLAS
jgi:hypothetical protein